MITYQPKPHRASIGPCQEAQSIISRMANTMRIIAFSGQTADENRLRQEGYSLHEIYTYGQRASEVARRRSIKQAQ